MAPVTRTIAVRQAGGRGARDREAAGSPGSVTLPAFPGNAGNFSRFSRFSRLKGNNGLQSQPLPERRSISSAAVPALRGILARYLGLEALGLPMKQLRRLSQLASTRTRMLTSDSQILLTLHGLPTSTT
jgi:hypothetical protein